VKGRLSASISDPRTSAADPAAAFEPHGSCGTGVRASVRSSTDANTMSVEGKEKRSSTEKEAPLKSNGRGEKFSPTKGGSAPLSSSYSPSDEKGEDAPVAAECIELLMSSSSSSMEDGKEETPKPSMIKQVYTKDDEQDLRNRVSAALQKASGALSKAGKKKSGILPASAESVGLPNDTLNTSGKNKATVLSVDAGDDCTPKASRALTKAKGKISGIQDALVSVGKPKNALDASVKHGAKVLSVDRTSKASLALTKVGEKLSAASVESVRNANKTLDVLTAIGANALIGCSQKESRALSKASRKTTVISDASLAEVGNKKTATGTSGNNGARVLSVDAVDDRTGEIIQLSSPSTQGASICKKSVILAKKRTYFGHGKIKAPQTGSDVSLRLSSKVTDLEIAPVEKKSKNECTYGDSLGASEKTTISHASFAGKSTVPIGSPSIGPRKISHALFSGTISLPSLSGADGGITEAKSSSGGVNSNASFRGHSGDINRLHRKRRRIFRGNDGCPSFIAAITITDSGSDSEDEEERNRRIEKKKRSSRFIVDVDAMLGLAPPPDKSPMYKRAFRDMFLRKAAEEEKAAVIPFSVSSSSAGGKIQKILAPPPGVWHPGVTSLALPDQAEEERNVSALHMFLRQNLELFSATEEDAAHSIGGRRTPAAVGRVGIRCVHCARAVLAAPPMQRRWAAGAISYPANIAGIYPCVAGKPGLHFTNCPHLPTEQREELRRITFDVDGQPKRQPRGAIGTNAVRYYVYAAKRWGVVEAVGGMRFGKDPKLGPFRAEEASLAKSMDSASSLPGNSAPVTLNTTTSSALTFATDTPANITSLPRIEADEASERVLARAIAEITGIVAEEIKGENNYKIKGGSNASNGRAENKVVEESKEEPASGDKCPVNATANHAYGEFEGKEKDIKVVESGITCTNRLVMVEERVFATDYVFLLALQMQRCHATSFDLQKRGKRSNNMHVGSSGFCCRHCAASQIAAAPFHQNAISGRFFASTSDSLSSVLGITFHQHLKKCPAVPNELKNAIGAYKKLHSQQVGRMVSGSLRRFYQIIWARLRESDKSEHEMQKVEEALRQDAGRFVTIDASAEDATNTPSAAPKLLERHPNFPKINDEGTKRVLSVAIEQALEVNDGLIFAEDQMMLTDHVFLVAKQAKVAWPSSMDFISPGKSPAKAQPAIGLCCRHCAGRENLHIGAGRTFPTAADNLASYMSVSLHNHLLKCVWVPHDLKDALVKLKKLHQVQIRCIPMGSQRGLFHLLFARLKAVLIDPSRLPVTNESTVSAARTSTDSIEPSQTKGASDEDIKSFGFVEAASGWFVCAKCRMIPLELRAVGSLSESRPNIEFLRLHKCYGNRFEMSTLADVITRLTKRHVSFDFSTLQLSSFKKFIDILVGGHDGLLRIFTDGIVDSQQRNADIASDSLWCAFPPKVNHDEARIALNAFIESTPGLSSALIRDKDFQEYIQVVSPSCVGLFDEASIGS